MIDAILNVMARPITFILVTLFSLLLSIYAILSVETLDLIRLLNVMLMDAILVGVQLIVIILNRMLHK